MFLQHTTLTSPRTMIQDFAGESNILGQRKDKQVDRSTQQNKQSASCEKQRWNGSRQGICAAVEFTGCGKPSPGSSPSLLCEPREFRKAEAFLSCSSPQQDQVRSILESSSSPCVFQNHTFYPRTIQVDTQWCFFMSATVGNAIKYSQSQIGGQPCSSFNQWCMRGSSGGQSQC